MCKQVNSEICWLLIKIYQWSVCTYDTAHGVLKGKVVCGDDNKTFMIKLHYTDAQNFNGL